ncbi:MAG: DUF2298 domain-containing protein [Halobacteriales archaeon]|nr:DUF2298 domain-containing protein [Halobacteriales archaeon]
MEYGLVVLWWMLYLSLGLAGLPIAATILDRLPDRGAGLAYALALAIVFLIVYWLGHLVFAPWVPFVGIGVLAVLSVIAGQRDLEIDWTRVIEAATIFSLAFGLLIAIRAVDPSIQPLGGEKFLDYGLLNSVLRARQLPPTDMWFAGEPVSYYYGGHLLAGTLAIITGTSAKYAYNLALAGFYGALIAGAYSLAGAVAAARGRSFRTAGLLGAFFVGFASNLQPLVRLVLSVLPAPIARPIATTIAAGIATEADVLTTFSIETFSYWTASRVIPGTINEFPLFAWLNGDLHAHMMSTPFLLLAVGLAFAYYRTPAADLRRRRLLVFGCLPPVVALLAVVNTWSFPSAIGVAWLALVFGAAEPTTLLGRTNRGTDRLGQELRRLGWATGIAGVIGVLALLWSLPFFLGTATGRSIGVLPERSSLVGIGLVHGWVLVIFGLYIADRLTLHEDRRRLAAGLVGFVGVMVLAKAAAVGLVLPLLGIAWYLLRTDGDVGFEAVLFVAGAGLVLLVEFVYVKEQAGPERMNTVFKTYMQVWLLWAIGAAVALTDLLSRKPDSKSGTVDAAGWLSAERRRQAATILLSVLVVSLSLYGGFALYKHFENPQTTSATLDGTWKARHYDGGRCGQQYDGYWGPDQWEAIQFLDGQTGRPTIVTAPAQWTNPDCFRPYDWMNAPSSFTGLPTVAGWSHEIGYRGEEPFRKRTQEVRQLYQGTTAQQTRLLATYDIKYVYVGPQERGLYKDVTITEHPALTVVFENGAVTIYAVQESELGAN